MNFAGFLELRARSAPDETALVDGDEVLTWSALDRLASRFAAVAVSAGCQAGDRIACVLPNCADFVIGFLGALKAGCVFVPINTRLVDVDLGVVVRHAAPRVILLTPDRRALLGDIPGPLAIECDGGAASDFRGRLSAAADGFRMMGRQSADAANLIFTSGTTGTPKGAIHTHGMRFAIAAGMADCFRLSLNDAALVVTPMFHIGGLNVLCNALFVGCKIVLLRKWGVPGFVALLAREKVTYMQLVSTMLVDIAAAPAALFDGWTPSVRFAWGGGHNVDPQTILAFEKRLGGVFLLGWGRTEGGFTYNPPSREERRFDAHGVANANASHVIVYDHAHARRADAMTVGEILVRGDGVSPGYWDGDFIRARPLVDGLWHPTGDMGWFDDQGQLNFVGRTDHMIKTGGENVYPSEVEAVLLEHPGVADAVVLGMPDTRLGQRICALVVRRSRELDAAELDRACRAALAGFKIPRRIEFVDELPRLANQKVDRLACLQFIGRTIEDIA